jgi:hypothetical protein
MMDMEFRLGSGIPQGGDRKFFRRIGMQKDCIPAGLSWAKLLKFFRRITHEDARPGAPDWTVKLFPQSCLEMRLRRALGGDRKFFRKSVYCGKTYKPPPGANQEGEVD